LGSIRDGGVLALLDREWNIGLDLGLAEEGNGAREEQRGVADVDPWLRHLPLLWRGSSGSATRGSDELHRLSSVVRGGGVRGQMSSKGEFRRGRGILYGRGGLGAGCTLTVTIGRERRCF
jgi:hypothetical protein